MEKIGFIVTGNTWFEMDFMTFRRTLMAKSLRRHGLQDMGPAEKAKPLLAFVNAGRWSIKCPDCGGGEYAFEERWVMCMSCFNAALGHKIRPVAFPKEREKIEALLLRRPLTNRNWEPGDTLATLKRENEEHKDKLLPVTAGEGGT